MESIETIIDDAANVATIDAKGKMRSGFMWEGKKAETPGGELSEWRKIWSQGTDAVMDVPLGGVCEVLYGGEEWDQEGDV